MSKDTAKDEPVLGYEYDGITEYDNPCPAWLMYIFYSTIFFAVFYLGYHFGSIKSEKLQGTAAVTPPATTIQAEEKPLEMSEAQVTALLTDPVALAKGKEVYASKCSSCHGGAGEGLIGPNLVDNYWLHGSGKTSEIANIIISGIPNTGMAAWRGRISEENILQVAAYVKFLKGTKPENPRDPEGKLIEE
ncbi:MAG: c-type cytochrome [Candidatus Kuenenia sp.]|nr:c-type cytochrome [Candidatus Kuenenia hertensis]